MSQPQSPALRSPNCAGCAVRDGCMIGRLPPSEYAKGYQHLVDERPFQKGDVLMREGETATVFQVVKLGMTLVLRRDRGGTPVPVALFGPGQVLGKFGLLRLPNPLTYVATSSGRLCQVEIEGMDRLGLWSPAFQEQLARACAKSYERLADWSQVMRVSGVTERLTAALVLLAESQRSVLVRLPSQRLMSELLGARRETIARAMRALERTEVVRRRDRWHCELLGPALALKARLR